MGYTSRQQKEKNKHKKKMHLDKPHSPIYMKKKVAQRGEEMPRKGHHYVYAEENVSKHPPEISKDPTQASVPNSSSIIRKKVDPETAKYFDEIANLFDTKSIDLEEHSSICGNALEEARGKELELSTDPIISRTLQNLLEGCDLDQLCSFLRNCTKVFSSIANDRFGSHVLETALKSLGLHIEDGDSHSLIEDALAKICKAVVVDSVNMMCSCYGSHVLRSLLCLCKGIPLDSLENFHITKPSIILAERLNSKKGLSNANIGTVQNGFPTIFKYLVVEMLNHAKKKMRTLLVDKYSSFVLQTALRLSVGNVEVLLHAIGILLGFDSNPDDISVVGLGVLRKKNILELLEDTAFSHLLEVIIEVAPEDLYNDLLAKVLKGSLFEISSHRCGNFVIQALIASTKTGAQVDMVWMELGSRFNELLENGKSGVVASLLASCQRLMTHTLECCDAVARSVTSDTEYPIFIVPHLLFLDSFVQEKSSWGWPDGKKMHTLGCLMLQTIFKFPNHIVQQYITSITSMEADHILQTAKDSGGSRVLDSFLCSDTSSKEKVKLITKLHGHFGELSMQPSSSFTVEKCFSVSNLSLKEAIVAELVAVQIELSKTKHGPYLLKKLDVNGYATRPEQWKSSQGSKENVYREFQVLFGSDSKIREQNANVQLVRKEAKQKHTKEKKNGDPGHEVSTAKSCSRSKNKDARRKDNWKSSYTYNDSKDHSSSVKGSVETSSIMELSDMAAKTELSQSEVRKLFSPSIKNNKLKRSVEESSHSKRQKRR